ncbi:MAG: hypothetical protein Q8L98_00545 [Chlamydiales bacterium]|nr:hypothetical protein [Chlamydiales bacterium]
MIAFFKKKEKTSPPDERKSFEEIVHERVLTAEGWRRKMLKKAKPLKK